MPIILPVIFGALALLGVTVFTDPTPAEVSGIAEGVLGTTSNTTETSAESRNPLEGGINTSLWRTPESLPDEVTPTLTPTPTPFPYLPQEYPIPGAPTGSGAAAP